MILEKSIVKLSMPRASKLRTNIPPDPHIMPERTGMRRISFSFAEAFVSIFRSAILCILLPLPGADIIIAPERR